MFLLIDDVVFQNAKAFQFDLTNIAWFHPELRFPGQTNAGRCTCHDDIARLQCEGFTKCGDQ